MSDYSQELGLNKYFQAQDAPITNRKKFVTGYEFSQGYEVQTKAIRASVITVERLVSYSGVATASGSVVGSSVANITFTLSPNDAYKNQTNLGIPFIAVYEGTAAVVNKQIYPNYELADGGKWYGNSGYDYVAWSGTNSVYTINLYNSGAGTSVYIVGQWKYISNNSGISSVA